jgi:hypothetical protein
MDQENTNVYQSSRLLIAGLVIVIIVLGFALVVMAIDQAARTANVTGQPVDALAQSENECVVCHRRTTPGIVEQYGVSTMAAAEVKCQDCHEVAADYPGALAHEGYQILASPTTAMCEKCHTQEVAQYYQSRHALPAYVAFAGSQELSAAHLVLCDTLSPLKKRGSFRGYAVRNRIR